MAEVENTYVSWLNLNSPFVVNNSVEFLEYRDISARKEQLNGNNQSVTFNIDYTDDYVLLDKCYFIIDLDLLKTDGTRYANTDEIALTNNGLMHLFSNVDLKVEGTKIESFDNPGIVTTIISLLKYDTYISNSTGKDFGWTLDKSDYSAKAADNTGFEKRKDYILKTTTTPGNYRYIVPFTHIFSTCQKVLKGAKIQITFLRSSTLDSNAIYKDSTQNAAGTADIVNDGKIVLNDMILMVCVPKLNDSVSATLNEYLIKNPKIPLQFGSKYIESIAVNSNKSFTWNTSLPSIDQKLYGIVVCFQTDRNNDQKKNSSLFDNLKVTNAEIKVNGISYPGSVLNSRDKKCYTDVYRTFCEFRKLFTTTLPEIDSKEFRVAYPLYCFDLTYQKTKVFEKGYQVNFKFDFESNVAANTTCYAIYFFEKYITFTTVGDHKMKPVVL